MRSASTPLFFLDSGKGFSRALKALASVGADRPRIDVLLEPLSRKTTGAITAHPRRETPAGWMECLPLCKPNVPFRMLKAPIPPPPYSSIFGELPA